MSIVNGLSIQTPSSTATPTCGGGDVSVGDLSSSISSFVLSNSSSSSSSTSSSSQAQSSTSKCSNTNGTSESSSSTNSGTSSTNNQTTTNAAITLNNRLLTCYKHKTNEYKYYCVECNQPLCQDCCLLNDHQTHEISSLQDVCIQQISKFQLFIDNSKLNAFNLRQQYDIFEQTLTYLCQKYHEAQAGIDTTYNLYKQLLDAKKLELERQLNQCFTNKKLVLTTILHKIKDFTSKLDDVNNFSENLLKTSKTETEILLFKKPLESIINNLLLSNNDLLSLNQTNNCLFDLGFTTNYQNYQLFQQTIKDTFGLIKDPQTTSTSTSPVTPICTTIPTTVSQNSATTSPISLLTQQPSKPIEPPNSISNVNSYSPKLNDMFENLLKSNDSSDIVTNSVGQSADLTSLRNHQPLDLLTRETMKFSCKFGGYGIDDGQFTEPGGIAFNLQNDIIITDTKSHRIQIFDREGRFKFKFGKNDGQLSYPKRVAVVKQTGDIIVTKLSPTHQIQIYNKYGQFVRKFGANILQNSRGVCVDMKGRIIVVESKVLRVIIFDQMGDVIHKFNCSSYLQFPNSICCNDKQEIFISDNHAHCIKVFDYEGQFLRQIGGRGITNYPIGVGINSSGQVLVIDNHNSFNITVFTQTGKLITAFQSKMKHAQCLDVGLMDDDSVVLAGKDYRIYVYKMQPQQ